MADSIADRVLELEVSATCPWIPRDRPASAVPEAVGNRWLLTRRYDGTSRRWVERVLRRAAREHKLQVLLKRPCAEMRRRSGHLHRQLTTLDWASWDWSTASRRRSSWSAGM